MSDPVHSMSETVSSTMGSLNALIDRVPSPLTVLGDAKHALSDAKEALGDAKDSMLNRIRKPWEPPAKSANAAGNALEEAAENVPRAKRQRQ